MEKSIMTTNKLDKSTSTSSLAKKKDEIPMSLKNDMAKLNAPVLVYPSRAYGSLDFSVM